MDASTRRAFSGKSACLKELNPMANVFRGKAWPGMSLRATVYDFSDILIFLMDNSFVRLNSLTNPECFSCLFLYVGNKNIANDLTQFSLKRLK